MGNVAYWLVLLLFLPAIVGALQIEGLMTPLTGMTSSLLGMLPNIFAAVIIAGVGWLIAKAVRGLVSNLLATTGIDRWSERHPDTRGLKLSDLGFDRLPARLGLGHAFRDPDAATVASPTPSTGSDVLMATSTMERAAEAQSAFTPTDAMAQAPRPSPAPAIPVDARAGGTLSAFAGKLALFFVMLFATVEAASLLGFAGINALLQQFIDFGADVLLGLVILGVGWWLADVAGRAIERANPQSRSLARIVRFAILGLVTAMGLRAMGVADDIVNLAFGLVLGAIAVAVALAFGLGGRDAAGKIANRWADEYVNRRPPDRP
jgi:hypothetical protein